MYALLQDLAARGAMERADALRLLRSRGPFTQQDFGQACRARLLRQLTVDTRQAVLLGPSGAEALCLCRRTMQRLSKESVAKQLLERRVGSILAEEGWVFAKRLNPYLTEYHRGGCYHAQRGGCDRAQHGDQKLYLALKMDNYKARGVRDLVARYASELFSGRAILVVGTTAPQTLQAFSRHGAAFRVFDLGPVRGKTC